MATRLAIYNYTPTATRLALRNNISQPVSVDPSLAPIYGCPIAKGMALCPGSVVLRPYPQYQSVAELMSPDGFNRYNSLQVKTEKRYSYGLNFILAYTIQKNLQSPNLGSILANTTGPTTLNRPLGRISSVAGAGGGAASDGFAAAAAEDPDNRRRYTALGPDDIPQILNLAATYELPVGNGKRFLNRGGWSNRLAGGWKLTQNWNIQSGVPLFFDSLACDGISCRPNLIGNPSGGRGSKTRAQVEEQYFNAAAFEAPFGSDPNTIQAVTTGVYPNGQPF